MPPTECSQIPHQVREHFHAFRFEGARLLETNQHRICVWHLSEDPLVLLAKSGLDLPLVSNCLSLRRKLFDVEAPVGPPLVPPAPDPIQCNNRIWWLDRYLGKPEDSLTPERITQAGRAIRQFHDAAHSLGETNIPETFRRPCRFGNDFPWSGNFFAPLCNLPDDKSAIVAQVRQRIAEHSFQSAFQQSPLTLNHGDLKPTNILWGTEPGPILIDFEESRRGHAVWDLGFFCSEYLMGQLRKDRMERDGGAVFKALCEGYGPTPWIDGDPSFGITMALLPTVYRFRDDPNEPRWAELARELLI